MTAKQLKYQARPGGVQTAAIAVSKDIVAPGSIGATARKSSNPSAASDEALLKRVAARDSLAMQALFSRYYVRVYRFALRHVGNPAVAEDVTSEVFLSVWQYAGRFEGRSAVSTWLQAIARFKALSALRRGLERPLSEEMAEVIEDLADDPEVALEKQDKSAILRKCLKRLSPEHREMIDLVYYHEKSVDEVSRIVGVPAATVKTRMFYARSKMADLLKQAGVSAL